MEHKRLIDRRQFTLESALAALSGVVITISGCGGGGGGGMSYSNPTSSTPPDTTPPASSGDKVGSISNNHLHSAVITGAQLVAANAVQLDIRGQADHTHSVVLGADAIASIKGGATFSADSTATDTAAFGNHLHTVTFNGSPNQSPGDGY
jgi:hypothetical protein